MLRCGRGKTLKHSWLKHSWLKHSASTFWRDSFRGPTLAPLCWAFRCAFSLGHRYPQYTANAPPATGCSFRPTHYTAALDDWRRLQPDLPSRSETIRRLIRQALKLKDVQRCKRLPAPLCLVTPSVTPDLNQHFSGAYPARSVLVSQRYLKSSLRRQSTD